MSLHKPRRELMSESLFPAQRSLLSAPALAERVLINYNLSSSPTCQFWRRSINDLYLAKARGTKFVLRISPTGWRSYEQLTAEINWVQILSSPTENFFKLNRISSSVSGK